MFSSIYRKYDYIISLLLIKVYIFYENLYDIRDTGPIQKMFSFVLYLWNFEKKECKL
jgi:hypothetical protein